MSQISKVNYKFILICISTLLINLILLYRYQGLIPSIIYLIFFLFIVLFTYYSDIPRDKNIYVTLTVIVVSLLLQGYLFWRFNPLYGGGIDRIDALNIWIKNLLDGNFPYSSSTSLGNPISVLPFMPILAMPFFLIGKTGLITVFGYLLTIGILFFYYKDNSQEKLFTVCLISFSPILFIEIIGQSDLITNVALLIAVVFLIDLWHEKLNNSIWMQTIIGILLGCVISTRIVIFAPITIIILFLYFHLNRKPFFRIILYAFLTASILILPFVLWNRDTFFNYAPIGVNMTKLGTSIYGKLISTLGVGLLSIIFGIYVKKSENLFLLIALSFALAVSATWFTFSKDYSLFQLIFIPLLFSLPRNYRFDKQLF